MNRFCTESQCGRKPWADFCSSLILTWCLSLALLILPVGCVAVPPTSPPGPTSTSEPEIDPRDVLLRAVDRVRALETSEFTLEHRAVTTVLLPGIEMNKVYGVADIPDKYRFNVEAEVANTFVKTSVVVIEDQAYMTNFLTGQWQEVSLDILPLNFADLGRTLAGIIQAVSEPTLVGVDRLDDRDVYVIKGRVMSNDLSTLVPNAAPGFDVELELWVGRSEALLLQVVISGQLLDTDAVTTVRVLTLDNIDLPVTIVLPE